MLVVLGSLQRCHSVQLSRYKQDAWSFITTVTRKSKPNHQDILNVPVSAVLSADEV